MGGSAGVTAAKADDSKTNASQGNLDAYTNGQSDKGVKNVLAKYGNGGLSLQDALASVQGTPGGRDALMTDGLTGSKIAADQVQNGALTKGLFGQGGIQDQAQGQFGKLGSNLDESREDLKGKGESYGLQNSDLKAYGQASDNIGRQAANQGQNLSQMLADRGLAAAPSGAAVQAYSGLAGNQNEQLAHAQQQISQNRIQTAQGLAQSRMNSDMQRQAQNNNLMQGLGQLGQQAQKDQFGRQMAGAENNYNELSGTAGTDAQNQAMNQNINNEAFKQQQATKQDDFGTTIGKAATAGLANSVGAIAGSPGTLVNSALGAGGGSASKSLSALL